MKFHELEVATKQSTKRVGRGIAAGGGKTAGRGTKGQKARTGKKIKLGFEGGQTKLSSRLPKKRGFTARNQATFRIINLDDLARVSGATISNATLLKAGLIRDEAELVKLLGDGEVTTAYTVELRAVSTAARDKITKAGGEVKSTLFVARPTAKRSKKQKLADAAKVAPSAAADEVAPSAPADDNKAKATKADTKAKLE